LQHVRRKSPFVKGLALALGAAQAGSVNPRTGLYKRLERGQDPAERMAPSAKRSMQMTQLLATAVAFAAGLIALMGEWHHWQQLTILFCFFVFMIAVGSFQVGLAVQALSNGFVRLPGDEVGRIAPTSLYRLLLAPGGDEVGRGDRPLRFWFEVLCRLALGAGLVFFPSFCRIYGSFHHH
jgi:hypothetical protein